MSEKKLVKLLKCGRASCGHIRLGDEHTLSEGEGRYGGRKHLCPQCGNDSYFILDEKGKIVTASRHELYRDGVDPFKIEPAPRLGPKMKQALMLAKGRALAALSGAVETKPERPKPYTSDELFRIALSRGKMELEPMRVLAIFADENNWRQHYGGKLAGGEKVDGCKWSFVGPVTPPYELAQQVIDSELESELPL